MKKKPPTKFFITCPGCKKAFDIMRAKHGWRLDPDATKPLPARRKPYVECTHCHHVF